MKQKEKNSQHCRTDRLRTNNLDILLEVDPPIPVVSDRIFGLSKEDEVKAVSMFKVLWSFTNPNFKIILQNIIFMLTL